MSDLGAEVTQVELAVFLQPAHHTEFVLSSAGKTIAGFSVRLMGWTAAETSGSAGCEIDIYDGVDTTGSIVVPIKLASGQSSTDWYGPNGTLFKNGVYVNLSSGQAKGSIFFNHVRG
jgi:hypothetical protein